MPVIDTKTAWTNDKCEDFFLFLFFKSAYLAHISYICITHYMKISFSTGAVIGGVISVLVVVALITQLILCKVR